jgi:hypothetical protein
MNQNLTGGRLAAIIAGGVLASIATLVLLAGAGFQWLDNEKDADGYYNTSSERFSTNTYALASDNLDIDDGWPGHARLKVRSDGGEPVFVGVARTRDVDAYLDRSAHTTVEDIETGPFDADYDTVGGSVRPPAPGTQGFWAAHSQGTGTQTLTWDVDEGDWSLVVMNADGSAGVHTDISAGVDLPFVDDAATGFIIGGLIGIAIGGALITFGMVGPRRRETFPPALA